MNYTSITLGELLSSENETIKRNAVSILKQLQKKLPKDIHSWKCSECDFETFWTMKDVANKGEPVCPYCDVDMEFN